jgi:putative tryptophan/tyrosine transport system substrate-binding protein
MSRISRRVPRVGSLWQGDPFAPNNVRITEAFRQGLQELGGYVEGKNIAIEYRHGNLDNLAILANDLVRLDVDVILAGGMPAALAAKRATNTIPIVGSVMADPVADGLVASLARPGGNVTGNTFLAPELGPKRLELLREVIPGVRRLAVLQHPSVYSERTMREMLEGLRTAAFGIELQVLEVSGPNEFETVFSAMTENACGRLWTLSLSSRARCSTLIIDCSLISPQNISCRLCTPSPRLWRPEVSCATGRIYLTSSVGQRLTLIRF